MSKSMSKSRSKAAVTPKSQRRTAPQRPPEMEEPTIAKPMARVTAIIYDIGVTILGRHGADRHWHVVDYGDWYAVRAGAVAADMVSELYYDPLIRADTGGLLRAVLASWRTDIGYANVATKNGEPHGSLINVATIV
jgi:hypothetical protein